jgi:hypothetical protein
MSMSSLSKCRLNRYTLSLAARLSSLIIPIICHLSPPMKSVSQCPFECASVTDWVKTLILSDRPRQTGRSSNGQQSLFQRNATRIGQSCQAKMFLLSFFPPDRYLVALKPCHPIVTQNNGKSRWQTNVYAWLW